MKRKQTNIYSLVDDQSSEFSDEPQSPVTNRVAEQASRQDSSEPPAQGAPLEASDLPGPGAVPKPRLEESEKPVGFMEQEFCPRCQQETMVRLRRRRWMRLLPGTQHCRCLECNIRFLLVGRLRIKLANKKN